MAKLDEFNANSQFLTASVLSAETEKDGYRKLFDQNVILILVSLAIFLIVVTVLMYKHAIPAFLSVLTILMVIFATFGFMTPPFTPSVMQFLPYLALGIGVDDLFVIL